MGCPRLAADLVGRKVDLIVAEGPPSASAAKNATSTIPIVFSVGTDPVADGLVASLARPGCNLTGVSIRQASWRRSGLSCFPSWSRRLE